MSSFQNVKYKMEKKQIRTIFLFQFKVGQNGCLTNWLTTKRNALMKWHLPFFYATRRIRFSTGLWLAMKSGFFTKTGDAQLRRRRSSTTLPEARVAPKEGYADRLVVFNWSHSLQFFECRRNHYGEVLSINGWNASETSTITPSINQEKRPNSAPRQCLTTSC